MTEVIVDRADLESMSHSMGEFMEFALDVVKCLAVSGDHGTRQGLTMVESIAGFDSALVPALHQAIESVRRHGLTTMQLAAAVSNAEESTIGDVGSRQGSSEEALTSTPVAVR